MFSKNFVGGVYKNLNLLTRCANCVTYRFSWFVQNFRRQTQNLKDNAAKASLVVCDVEHKLKVYLLQTHYLNNRIELLASLIEQILLRFVD